MTSLYPAPSAAAADHPLFLTFVGFSLSYFTPHAPLQGASLWNAWLFWFEGVLHWDLASPALTAS